MLVLVLLTSPLVGCPTDQPEPVCGTVTSIDKATQAKAAAELRTLPAGSALGTVIVPDWVRSRDEARACAAKG